LSKLKTGSFGVVSIYLEGLRPRLADVWKKIKKKPKIRKVDLVSDAEIKEAMELAKKEHNKKGKDFKPVEAKSNEEMNAELEAEQESQEPKEGDEESEEKESKGKKNKKAKKDKQAKNQKSKSTKKKGKK
ncbi:hypothetical protein KY321_01050, partial [Candidatus Woesearchaeota archaeon]|nr:hypothetical protein [Candidatus Woesearchaeota archaeon]